MKPYRDFFKRAIDISASGLGLLVLSPILGAVTVWLHYANKGAGAFFRQERPGKGGKIFNVIFTTIKKVVKRADISQEGQATMEEFNGKN